MAVWSFVKEVFQISKIIDKTFFRIFFNPTATASVPICELPVTEILL